MNPYKVTYRKPQRVVLSLRPVCTITVDILKFFMHSTCMHGHAFDLLWASTDWVIIAQS